MVVVDVGLEKIGEKRMREIRSWDVGGTPARISDEMYGEGQILKCCNYSVLAF
jgi:hypothetical protein